MKRQKNAGFIAEFIGRILAAHPSTGDEVNLRALRLEMFKDGVKGAEFTDENRWVMPNAVRWVNRHPLEARFRLQTFERGHGHPRGVVTFHWIQAAEPVKREQILPMNAIAELGGRVERCEWMLEKLCREWGINVPARPEGEWTNGGFLPKNATNQ